MEDSFGVGDSVVFTYISPDKGKCAMAMRVDDNIDVAFIIGARYYSDGQTNTCPQYTISGIF